MTNLPHLSGGFWDSSALTGVKLSTGRHTHCCAGSAGSHTATRGWAKSPAWTSARQNLSCFICEKVRMLVGKYITVKCVSIWRHNVCHMAIGATRIYYNQTVLYLNKDGDQYTYSNFSVSVLKSCAIDDRTFSIFSVKHSLRAINVY